MRHAAKYFRIVGILTGLAVSGCALDGPALEQEFTESSQVNFSVKGNVENALLFCGAKAWKAQKIDTVREAVQELFA